MIRKAKGTRWAWLRILPYVLGGGAYVVMPFDLVPELLLGPLGLVDDGVVVALVALIVSILTDRKEYAGRLLIWLRADGVVPGAFEQPRRRRRFERFRRRR